MVKKYIYCMSGAFSCEHCINHVDKTDLLLAQKEQGIREDTLVELTLSTNIIVQTDNAIVSKQNVELF